MEYWFVCFLLLYILCFFCSLIAGNFFLTKMLLDKMIDASNKTNIQGRIINVSSAVHSWAKRTCFCFKDMFNGKKYIHN